MLPIDMRPIAAIQELILWTCFMGGEMSRDILLLLESFLASSPSPPLHCGLYQALHHALTANLPRKMGVTQRVPTRPHRWIPT